MQDGGEESFQHGRNEQEHLRCAQVVLKYSPARFTFSLQSLLSAESTGAELPSTETSAVIHIKSELLQELPLLRSVKRTSMGATVSDNGVYATFMRALESMAGKLKLS